MNTPTTPAGATVTAAGPPPPPVTRHAFPDSKLFAATFSTLLGRAVQVKPARPLFFSMKGVYAVGSYLDASGALAAAWVSDVALAASAGAALVVLPPDLVAEAVKSGRLEGFVHDNFLEVLNVGATLFNGAERPHVKFASAVVANKPPDAVAALVKSPVARLDLEVAIAGYAGGRLALFGT